ncbi:MAG: rpoC, partial [Oscillospiraceae bacterium]|nr:rpoC [Oscillospiraceae bacterium]
HPLVCTAYNADFDGDQMAVHVPLSAEAQAEARFLMLAANNLLKPSDGSPVTVPTQDMVLGSYYLTMVRENEKGAGKVFRDFDEALMAYNEGAVTLHAPVKVRRTIDIDDKRVSKIIETTVGRIIFNTPIPQDLGYVDRTDYDSKFKLEVEFLVKKKTLGDIIDRCIRTHGSARTAEMLDQIKAQGFKYSTRGAITVAVCDAVIPAEKKELLATAEENIAKISRQYERGLISDEVRYERVIKTWNETTAKVKDALQKCFTEDNPIFMMADSGARGSMDQIRQLAGMRGLIANTSGRAIELPIKANYREGLTILDYFNSSRGARKGLADTALRTADSGYLTRRLVDVSQDVIIREIDCGTHEGIVAVAISDSGREIESLRERLIGRYVTDTVVHPKTGEVLMTRDRMMTFDDAERIVKSGVEQVKIRSVLNCESKSGVCAHCYGANLANGQPVGIGEAVGIIAAQSIGEPGTQLTMRTFHTGGTVTASDITQGLPRIEELFEARKPKNAAIVSHLTGIVSYEKDPKGGDLVVVTTGDGERFEKQVIYGSTRCFEEGEVVQKGDLLTEGSAEPNEILAVSGHLAVQDYLIKEVQRVYRTQGVDISDKHIEVIVRQMMRKVRIDDGGDSSLIPGVHIEKSEFININEDIYKKAEKEGREPNYATCIPVLLGITKASLVTESFLSAASFQETTRVLTEAAIKGKVDPLLGLKENVIIGKLVPAGTGTVPYDDVTIKHDHPSDRGYVG